MKFKEKIFLVMFMTMGFLLIALSMIYALTSSKKSDINEEYTCYDALELDAPVSADDEIPDVNWSKSAGSGYYILSYFYFTSNIDRDKAVEVLKDYLLFYDGEPVHSEYEFSISFENGNYAILKYTLPDGSTKSLFGMYYSIASINGMDFACATDLRGARYEIVYAKNTVNKESDLSYIPQYIQKRRYEDCLITPSFHIDYNESLQEENDTWYESYTELSNGNYYKAICNARILNNLTVDGFTGVENNDEYVAPVVEDEPAVMKDTSSIQDYFSGIADAAKTKGLEVWNNLKDNNTFKIVTSGVLGCALVYVLYLIIRRICHVVGR